MSRLSLLIAVFGAILLPPSVATAATVEGSVTPVQWAQEVEVCASYGTLQLENCAVPGPDGSYVYPGIVGRVTFVFIPTYRSRLLTQYYDRKEAATDATYLTLGPQGTVMGIDADLNEGGSIAGVVTAEAGGAALSEVEVCGVSVSSRSVQSCEETDAAGDYELHSLASGLYDVNFHGHGDDAGFEPSVDRSVIVTAGATASAVNASLAEGARVAGTVDGPDGIGLEGLAVCLFAPSSAAAERCTETTGEGAYVFLGLPAGGYEIGFDLGNPEISGTGATAEVGGYVPQYYVEAATRAQASPVSLLPAQALDSVNATLARAPAPPSLVPATAVSNPIVAAAPVVVESTAKGAGCKRGYRETKAKGKVRCVKIVKHKKRPRRKHAPKRGNHHRRSGKK